MTREHDPLGLFTDLYQLTMAQAYWKAGMDRREACFHLLFRANPFGGGFAVFAGLEQVCDYLARLSFTEEDVAFLAEQTGNDGRALFDPTFLATLRDFDFACDIDAVAEGTAVFAGAPVVRVTGPLPHCQLVETALLNIVNFQTLVATKAARTVLAAEGDPVVEFGLRRAQGPDGGLSASRAAYVGGAAGTSNTLAGKRFGIPVAGTHAHSWVMAFDSEQEAFDAYADAMPNNCTFLVDTYDTIEGVRHAVDTGRRLRERGFEMIGVRIDSGDLAWLSRHARRILDESGFADAKVFASNELDEATIRSLKEQGAAIDVWGVGTKLATAWDQPALGGVYKLSAIRDPGGPWIPRIKVSEQTAKVTTPGVLGVRRYLRQGRPDGDMVYDTRRVPEGEAVMVDPADPTRRKVFSANESFVELLQPLYRSGSLVAELPPIALIRERSLAQVAALDPSVTRFLNPHTYPVGLEQHVADERLRLVLAARGIDSEEGR